MKNMTWFVATAGILMLVATPSRAAVLYMDDFSGDGTGNLSGTAPDVTVGTNTWQSGSSVFKDDGTVDGGSARSGVWVPFTPESGYIYTMTATIDSQEDEGNWISLGFSQSASAVDNRAVDGSVAAIATIWIRGATAADNEGEFFYGDWGTTGVEGTVTGLTVPAPHDVKIVMDTTDADVANWTTAFFVDGVSVGAPAVSATAYTGINWAGFTTTNMAGAISDFELTRVPEPASVVLLGLAAVAGCFVARRRS